MLVSKIFTNRQLDFIVTYWSTGVGKTELAKQLAIKLFGKADALVRLDMSEYQDQMAVNQLIGSAPGYVGYGEADNWLKRFVATIFFDIAWRNWKANHKC